MPWCQCNADPSCCGSGIITLSRQWHRNPEFESQMSVLLTRIFSGNLQGSIVLRGHAQSAEGNFYGCLSGCSVQTHAAVKCKLESLTLSLFGNVSY